LKAEPVASKTAKRLSTDPERSALMGKVRQKGTAPELIVRRRLHQNGFRFRLHRRTLPGTPDIVLPGRKIAVFVNGCFWHRHEHCSRSTTPKRNAEFWNDKFERNKDRDRDNYARLADLGWSVFIVWECEASSSGWLGRFLRDYGEPRPR
jgi:DNA mismatch endonuclease (patch repair protein)